MKRRLNLKRRDILAIGTLVALAIPASPLAPPAKAGLSTCVESSGTYVRVNSVQECTFEANPNYRCVSYGPGLTQVFVGGVRRCRTGDGAACVTYNDPTPGLVVHGVNDCAF